MRRFSLGAAFVLLFAVPLAAQERGRPGEFDLYVLSLSWSPTYCLTDGARRGDQRQCDTARPRAFVLHGLWPQYERGWPEFCWGDRAQRVADGTVVRMLDIMPSPGLVQHQWRKHGTCSGLVPQAYFDTARRAFESITVPERYRTAIGLGRVDVDEVERDFVAANPGLTRDMIAVTCQDGMLDEVRICLSRTLQPRRCAEVNARACRARSVRVPGAGGRS
jgi:ribonuclease T2